MENQGSVGQYFENIGAIGTSIYDPLTCGLEWRTFRSHETDRNGGGGAREVPSGANSMIIAK